MSSDIANLTRELCAASSSNLVHTAPHAWRDGYWYWHRRPACGA